MKLNVIMRYVMARNAVISLTYVVNVGTFNEQKMVVYESSVYNWTNSAANLWIIDVTKMSNRVYVSNHYFTFRESYFNILLNLLNIRTIYKISLTSELFYKQNLKQVWCEIFLNTTMFHFLSYSKAVVDICHVLEGTLRDQISISMHILCLYEHV